MSTTSGRSYGGPRTRQHHILSGFALAKQDVAVRLTGLFWGGRGDCAGLERMAGPHQPEARARGYPIPSLALRAGEFHFIHCFNSAITSSGVAWPQPSQSPRTTPVASISTSFGVVSTP